MNPDIRMDPRLERRIGEKRRALDIQRPLPPAIVAKLYEDLRVRLTYHCYQQEVATGAIPTGRPRRSRP